MKKAERWGSFSGFKADRIWAKAFAVSLIAASLGANVAFAHEEYMICVLQCYRRAQVQALAIPNLVAAYSLNEKHRHGGE